MTVKIYWPDGVAPYTSTGVHLATAETHIAARDQYADDAAVLLEAYNSDDDYELPDGYEWADE